MTDLPALTPERIAALERVVRARIAARRAVPTQDVIPTPAPVDEVFLRGQRWLARIGYAPDEWEDSDPK